MPAVRWSDAETETELAVVRVHEIRGICVLCEADRDANDVAGRKRRTYLQGTSKHGDASSPRLKVRLGHRGQPIDVPAAQEDPDRSEIAIVRGTRRQHAWCPGLQETQHRIASPNRVLTPEVQLQAAARNRYTIQDTAKGPAVEGCPRELNAKDVTAVVLRHNRAHRDSTEVPTFQHKLREEPLRQPR